jgi:hypothetical protein
MRETHRRVSIDRLRAVPFLPQRANSEPSAASESNSLTGKRFADSAARCLILRLAAECYIASRSCIRAMRSLIQSASTMLRVSQLRVPQMQP